MVQRDVSEGLLIDAPVQEQEMWRAHWEDCCRRLNYWELLCEFAKANKRLEMLVQTCWKIGEWVSVLHRVTHTLLGPDERNIPRRLLPK